MTQVAAQPKRTRSEGFLTGTKKTGETVVEVKKRRRPEKKGVTGEKNRTRYQAVGALTQRAGKGRERRVHSSSVKAVL